MPKDRKAKAKKERQKKQNALLQKKEYRQIRDKYYNSFIDLAERLDLKDWFCCFSPSDIHVCYKTRITATLFREVGPHKLPEDVKQFARELFPYLINNKEFTYPNGAKVSGNEVMYILEKFCVATLSKKMEQPELYARFQKKIDAFTNFMEDSLQQLEAELHHQRKILSWISSAPDKELYAFTLSLESNDYEDDHPLSASWTSKYCISAEAIPVPSRAFAVEGNRRTGFRYGFPLSEGKENLWLTLPARFFGITEQEMLDVYIQSHALIRLMQRVDTIPFGIAFALSTFELKDKPKVRKVGSNSFLIDVVIKNLKVGYFVACLVGNAVLIKTFLFVTSSASPEGRKLDALTGLKKLDKQFLGIDRLSTYLALDINKSPELISIFQEAGLEELLRINKEMFTALSALLTEINHTENSEFIASYIARRTTELSLSQVEAKEGEIALK